MAAGITRIDHPVIAVADMAEARRAYGRLGFTVPPEGRHLEWGTGNWCIMFPEEYLELRGIVDASRYTHHLNEFLAARGEGLMGLAFATRDADASYAAAKASGLAPAPVKELTRRFLLPEGDAFPKFRIVSLSEADAPGLLTTVICGHLTPEIIRREEWLAHPNGAMGVLSITAVVAEPRALKPAYERLLGPDAVSEIEGGLGIAFGIGSALEILAPAAAARRGLVLAGAKLPYLPAMSVAVRDLRATRAVLERNGVRFAAAADSLRVEPAESCGVILSFAAPRHGR
jgi:catechol 2,3-dioxygenase-like lactoylglutathione lyase family enzyme